MAHEGDATPAYYGELRYNSRLPYPFPEGRAELSDNHYRVLATAGNLTVTATRREGSTGPLTVNYATTDGTDLAGRDYTATSGTLSWADGDATPKTFSVPVFRDGAVTPNLNVNLRLTGKSLGEIAQATLTITNTDLTSAGLARFSSANFQAGSDGGQATITVNRAGGSAGALNVNYATSDGTAAAGVDYVATTGTLTWADGDVAPKVFMVPVLDTHSAGAGRSLLIQLTGKNLGTVTQAVLTISGNATAAPTVAVAVRTPLVAEEDGGVAIFLVTRTGDTTAPLTCRARTAVTSWAMCRRRR